MATIHRFEDLDAWQEAKKLTAEIYAATTRHDRFSKDWGLSDQAQRAAVSTMTNIVEGFDSGSNAEFIRFLGYARRSASELQSLLYVAVEQAYVTKEQFAGLYDSAEKVRRMVTSLTRYLRSQRRTTTSLTTRQRANALTG